MRQGAISFLLPVLGGALVGLSVSPVGGWWFGVAGAAVVVLALDRPTPARRFLAGLEVGIGQFALGLVWSLQFSGAGYATLVLVESLILAVAAALLVVPERGLLLPTAVGALTLAEWARQSWPFGGLPLGSASLGQVGGPLQFAARLGGPLLVVAALAAGSGGGLVLLLSLRRSHGRVGTAWGVVGLGACAAVVLGGYLSAPPGHHHGPSVTAAVVQGGGVRGLDQLEVPASRVFSAALRETARVHGRPSLIVWPEDTVSTGGVPFSRSPQERVLARLARRRRATFVVGVVYDVGTSQFRNEIVALSPAGRIVATFEKVHRVPFGEYVPYRSFFAHFANLSDVPRDAVAGHGDGMITTPAGRLAVLVSYEVFFGERGRSGVTAGGRLIVVPTNTSSYSSDEAPVQELDASRLQAIEEGRYLLQAAPTGYSAIVSPSGSVLRATSLSAAAVLEARVPLLSSLTPYGRWGDAPLIVLSGALVAFARAAWLWERVKDPVRHSRHRRR